MKSFLRVIRINPVVAAILYSISRPLFDLSQALQSRIARQIKRNGGTAVYDGVPLYFPPNVGSDFLSAISWHGADGYERDTWGVLRSLIEKSCTFIDIGSNIGLYSVLAKKIAVEIDVFSFEPVPNLCEHSRRFHAANNVQASVQRLALGDCDGRATLYQPIESNPGETSASTLAGKSWQARKSHHEIQVETSRLDTFFSNTELREPVTIKIDVEDYEASVLYGAKETIHQYKPWIVCEILPRPKRPRNSIVPLTEQHGNAETITALKVIGYTAFAITPAGIFRFSDGDFGAERSFTDFLLVPKEQVPHERSYFPNVRDFQLAHLQSVA